MTNTTPDEIRRRAEAAGSDSTGTDLTQLSPVRAVKVPDDTAASGTARIEAGNGPDTIRAVRDALDSGDIPGTYVSSGRVVHVEQVSGAAIAESGEEDSPLPVTATVVGPPELAYLLARHTYTVRMKERMRTTGTGKDKKTTVETIEEEFTPPTPQLAAALAPKEWPDLRPLAGIVGAPVLRRDGTLLQAPGYDTATGLYLASKVPLDLVPERPTARQVADARSFIVEDFLGDFPWASKADKPNYIALQVTPILQRYLRTLTPFGLVTATTPSSGKTILTCGLGMLYGQRVLTWPGPDDAELRKAITAVLADPAGTIIFDNLPEGTTVDSAVLAHLITERSWADRLLGKNATAVFANDRVWTATGNNLRLGGDMRTRSVLIGLDPDMPDPENRSGFKIPNLDLWILDPANQRIVLRHLLILVLDWTQHGAPRQKGITMRQFTLWAEALGGFLDHHGIPGFLTNIETVRDIDDEEAMWTAFYVQWHGIFGSTWRPTNEIRLSADIMPDGTDRWNGLFVSDARGRIPNTVALGKILTGQIGRYRGRYVLRGERDSHTKNRVWCVEERPEQ